MNLADILIHYPIARLRYYWKSREYQARRLLRKAGKIPVINPVVREPKQTIRANDTTLFLMIKNEEE